MNIKVEHLLNCLLLLMIVIGIILMMLGLDTDEPFTMNLIHHSYSSIISIDSFDVHPPLYYLFLKSFLQITTFWTGSIFVQLVFARLFSLLMLLLILFLFARLFALVNVHIDWKIQLLLYLSFPSILYYSFDIRMYGLATMLIVAEIYGIVLFYIKDSLRGLFILALSLLLILYTNYFAAVFAGSFLFVNIIYYIVHCKLFKMFYLLIIGIFDILLFLIPYGRVFLHQVGYVSSNGYSNVIHINKMQIILEQLLGAFTGKPVSSILSVLFCIIFFIIEIFLSIYIINRSNRKLSRILIEIIWSFMIGFIPSIVLSFVSHPMIEWRYGYPMFAVMYFILISSISTRNVVNLSVVKYIMILCTICIGIGLYSISSDENVLNNDFLSFNVVKQLNFCKKKRNIYENGKDDPINTNKIADSSVYILGNDKYIIASNVDISDILAKNNRPLMRKVFNNVHLVGKSK